MSVINSKDNPRIRHWAKLAADARYRREKGRALIEGPHLLAAALQHGCALLAVLATERGMAGAEVGMLLRKSRQEPVVLSDAVFRRIADTGTPQGVAAEIEIPAPGSRRGDTVFLEGLQDPANVGAILRSAAAFGVAQVVLNTACADPWSPKALRAGMGGHFALGIRQSAAFGRELAAFRGTLICTVPREGKPLQEVRLKRPLGWIFGGEGAGLSEETLRRAYVGVTIPMAQGAESLNVAATAAICLYEAASRSGQ